MRSAKSPNRKPGTGQSGLQLSNEEKHLRSHGGLRSKGLSAGLMSSCSLEPAYASTRQLDINQLERQERTRSKWIQVMKKKEMLQEAHTKGIRDQLEKQFTREREYTKRFAEEREYVVHMCAEKGIKRANHLVKKQMDES